MKPHRRHRDPIHALFAPTKAKVPPLPLVLAACSTFLLIPLVPIAVSLTANPSSIPSAELITQVEPEINPEIEKFTEKMFAGIENLNLYDLANK